jgi:hypothetical protein
MAKFTSVWRCGTVEGYLCVQTQDAKTKARDRDSTLFLRYVEQWTGELANDEEDWSHSWRTATLVFGRRRFEREGEDVVVACETLPTNLFRDFCYRALSFLRTSDPTERVPGNVQYATDGFAIVIERDPLITEANEGEDGRDYVTVLLQDRNASEVVDKSVSAIVFIDAERLHGFFVQVAEVLDTLRGGESQSRRSRRRR